MLTVLDSPVGFVPKEDINFKSLSGTIGTFLTLIPVVCCMAQPRHAVT